MYTIIKKILHILSRRTYLFFDLFFYCFLILYLGGNFSVLRFKKLKVIPTNFIYITTNSLGEKYIIKFNNPFAYLRAKISNQIIKSDKEKFALLSKLKQSLPQYKLLPNVLLYRNKLLVEYIEGTNSLSDENMSGMGQHTKFKIKNELTKFVSDMHKLGISHGDLKIKNILFKKEDIYIIDWDYINDLDHKKQSRDTMMLNQVLGFLD